MTDPGALFEEGYRLYVEAECPEDLERARSLLGQAASGGHAMAMDVLGNMYEDGDGAEEDVMTALQLYRRSAEQGCPAGMYDLGVLYLDGRGVDRDEERAFALISKAVEAESRPDHMYRLSVMYRTGEGTPADDGKALELLRKAADLGSPEAKSSLGSLLLSGDGVEKDPERAFVLFKEAAEDQDCRAMCNLGLMYEDGIHVEKDLDAAVSYYRQALDLGFAPACYHLGLLVGQGLAPASLIDPSDVLGAGGRAGSPDDVGRLGELYYFGDGGEPDLEAAEHLFRAGVDLDVPSCMYNLGVMILRGEAASEYEGEEYDLILAAVDAGYAPAQELVESSEEEI